MNAVVEKAKQQRERVVIIALLAVLLGISWNVYSIMQMQKADQEFITRRILSEHGYRDPDSFEGLADELGPLRVADALLRVPSPEEIIRPLIEVDPLRPREDIHQVRQRIGMLIEEGRLLREQGKWADAIMTYEKILEIDPTGVKYDYRGGTPRELMEVCVREQTRERMVQVKAEADAGYQSGMALLNQGNELKARDVLIQTRRDYAQILDLDPHRSILDEAFYAAIDSRLEELTEVTRNLVQITLEEDIRSKREQAEKELQAFEANRSDLDRLAGAREALVESLNIIELVDPAGDIVSATQVEQIDARLGEVEEMISEALPDLFNKAQEQLIDLNKAQSVQEGIVRAEAALATLELLDRLRPDPEIQKRLNEVQAVYRNLRQNEDLQRARQMYEEAQAHYQKALEAFQRNDITRASNEKETTLAILARMRALPEENVKPWLERAEELERGLERDIQSLPRIQGVELTEVDPQGRWAVLRSRSLGWFDVRHYLNTTIPRTQLRVVEIHPNPEDEAPYVVISKPLHMNTKVSLGSQ